VSPSGRTCKELLTQKGDEEAVAKSYAVKKEKKGQWEHLMKGVPEKVHHATFTKKKKKKTPPKKKKKGNGAREYAPVRSKGDEG